MKIFIDSANLDEISKALDTGLIDGITTNPSLVARNNQFGNFYDIIKSIASLTNGDVSAEVSAENYDEMILQGNKILSIADNIVLKLPMTINGLRACKYFSSQNRHVNMTLCFSLSQAIMSAKVGAKYISPFVGRLEDINQDGISLISDIKTAYSNYNFNTKILAASIRNNFHFYQMATIGADVCTIPYKIFLNLINHPLTDSGIKIFKNDWEESKLKI